jgi:hypothetical protein
MIPSFSHFLDTKFMEAQKSGLQGSTNSNALSASGSLNARGDQASPSQSSGNLAKSRTTSKGPEHKAGPGGGKGGKETEEFASSFSTFTVRKDGVLLLLLLSSSSSSSLIPSLSFYFSVCLFSFALTLFSFPGSALLAQPVPSESDGDQCTSFLAYWPIVRDGRHGQDAAHLG